MLRKTARSVNKRQPVPLYRQIKEALLRSIESGELSPGAVLPSRPELCRLFNTNRITLDRAIRELVREGWLISVKGKGTFVTTERKLPNGKAKTALTFAILWHRFNIQDNNIYWGPLVRGIVEMANAYGAQLIFRQVEPDLYLPFWKEIRPDGLIVLAPLVTDEEILQRLRDEKVPFVATSSLFSDRSLPCVAVDNFAGVRMALEHLISLGHRAIALVDMDLQLTDLLQRMQAYQTILTEAKITIHPAWMLVSLTRMGLSVERIKTWLQSVPKPTAIFTADYEMALFTYQALHQMRWEIPTDISLVSFDDPISAAFLNPPLTTVRQPVSEIGGRAVEKLMQAIQKGKLPEGTEVLKPELVVRASTAPPKTEGTNRRK